MFRSRVTEYRRKRCSVCSIVPSVLSSGIEECGFRSREFLVAGDRGLPLIDPSTRRKNFDFTTSRHNMAPLDHRSRRSRREEGVQGRREVEWRRGRREDGVEGKWEVERKRKVEGRRG